MHRLKPEFTAEIRTIVGEGNFREGETIAMIDYGVAVYVPTEEELAAFKTAAAPTIKSYKDLVGAEGCKAFGLE